MASLSNVGTDKEPIWRIRYRNKGDKNPKCLTLAGGTGRREAEATKTRVQNAINEAGRWDKAEVPPMDLDAAIRAYMNHRSKPDRRSRAVSQGTQDLYRKVLLGQFLPFAAGRGSTASLHSLDATTVERFLDHKARGGSAEGTVYTYGATIRAFWKWAHARWPDHVGIPKMDVAPPPAGIIHAPTIAEVDRMIATLAAPVRGRNKHPRAVIRACLIMRFTGLRVSQAACLTWGDMIDDLDGRGPALHIRPANSKTRAEAALDRRIPVAPGLHKLLLSWRMADGRPGDSTIVVGPGMPRDPHTTVSGAWERSGVEPRKWKGRPDHTIRRAVITYLAEQGVVEPAIDWYVGHAPRSMNSRHYTSQSMAWWTLLVPPLQGLPDLPDTLAA